MVKDSALGYRGMLWCQLCLNEKEEKPVTMLFQKCGCQLYLHPTCMKAWEDDHPLELMCPKCAKPTLRMKCYCRSCALTL